MSHKYNQHYIFESTHFYPEYPPEALPILASKLLQSAVVEKICSVVPPDEPGFTTVSVCPPGTFIIDNSVGENFFEEDVDLCEWTKNSTTMYVYKKYNHSTRWQFKPMKSLFGRTI